MHPPMTPTEWTTLVVALLVLAVLLWALPSCGDETCTVAHTRHTVAHRAAEIERQHATWHGTDRPDPTCALCASRKRDEVGK